MDILYSQGSIRFFVLCCWGWEDGVTKSTRVLMCGPLFPLRLVSSTIVSFYTFFFPLRKKSLHIGQGWLAWADDNEESCT